MADYVALTATIGITGSLFTVASVGASMKILRDRATAAYARPRRSAVTVQVTYEDGESVFVKVPHPNDPGVAEALRELRHA